MLMLKRSVDEEIYIGEFARVAVTEIKGSSVKIGVDAPASVDVNRGEVHCAILAHRRSLPKDMQLAAERLLVRQVISALDLLPETRRFFNVGPPFLSRPSCDY